MGTGTEYATRSAEKASALLEALRMPGRLLPPRKRLSRLPRPAGSASTITARTRPAAAIAGPRNPMTKTIAATTAITTIEPNSALTDADLTSRADLERSAVEGTVTKRS